MASSPAPRSSLFIASGGTSCQELTERTGLSVDGEKPYEFYRLRVHLMKKIASLACLSSRFWGRLGIDGTSTEIKQIFCLFFFLLSCAQSENDTIHGF